MSERRLPRAERIKIADFNLKMNCEVSLAAHELLMRLSAATVQVRCSSFQRVVHPRGTGAWAAYLRATQVIGHGPKGALIVFHDLLSGKQRFA